jgi:hypothetical protein
MGLCGRCPRAARVRLASDSRTKSSTSLRSENSEGFAVQRRGVLVLAVLCGVVAIGLGDPGVAIGEKLVGGKRRKENCKMGS